MIKGVRNFSITALIGITFLSGGCRYKRIEKVVKPTLEQSKIAFSSKRDGNSEIYVMNADGSEQTNLTNNPNSDASPSWSPDGKKIAFESARDGGFEIYIMNADGSGQTILTNNPAQKWQDWHPRWSPFLETGK